MTTNDMSRLYSERSTAALANTLVGTYRNPATIKYRLGTGLPDSELFPIEELKEYSARALDERGKESLSYGLGGQGGFAGPLALREQLAKRTAGRHGREISPDGIVLTSGASHGLALTCNAYLSPGDAVFVEALSWPWASRYMTEAGAKIFHIPMDEDGMIVDRVEGIIEAARAEGLRPKMVYTIPTFHIPTATCMPLARREQLLEIVRKHDMVLLEDNLYADLRYTGERVPSFLALDDTGRVVQQNGFSKTLSTGLRMGWVTGTPEAMLAIEIIRQDLGVNQWMAHMLAMWMADGKWEDHIGRLVASAGRKHQIALKALRQYCEPLIRFQVPQGGIYYWCELAPEVDLATFNEQLVAEGVNVAPGERFSGEDDGRRFFRIAYLDVPDDALDESIAMLGKCLSQSVKQR